MDDLRDLTPDQLHELLVENQTKLFQQRLQRATERSDATHELAATKKMIARIKTFLHRSSFNTQP